jgi:Xaa-Pro aminopeptidase
LTQPPLALFPVTEYEDRLTRTRAALAARGERLGVEWDAFGLTAANGRRLAAALGGFGDLVDALDLVSRRRAAKRPAELPFMLKSEPASVHAIGTKVPVNSTIYVDETAG